MIPGASTRRATASPRAGKKEAKDKAKREQQERQRAEDLKRKAKREREAARNRERDRRLALWDPAKKACSKALQKDAETLTRALPWADLAAHYGVHEAADAQLLRDETPSLGAPNALNPKAQHAGTVYPLEEDAGLYPSKEPLLVADRVRDWYGSRANPNWRKRLLEVLASLAKGSDGSWCRAAHPSYKEFGVRIALLDDTMRLIWSATKASDGGLRCLAWCCVRTGSVDSTCEGIKQALDRRASDKGKLIETKEPYLTLDDDDVLIHPGKNRPMKLWSCRIGVLEKMAQGSPPEKWSPSLRLTTKEQAAVQEANAPAMVLTQRLILNLNLFWWRRWRRHDPRSAYAPREGAAAVSRRCRSRAGLMTYFREAVVNTQEMLDLLALTQR